MIPKDDIDLDPQRQEQIDCTKTGPGHRGCGKEPTLRVCRESHEATTKAQCPQCGLGAYTEVGTNGD